MQLTNTPPEIGPENEKLKEIDDFTYLGNIISKNNATEKDNTNRDKKTRAVFHQLNLVWRSRNIKTKIKIFKSSVLSVLLRVLESDAER
ncbi:hypothetical protein KUTeg_006629 [Tegillarca granosa]|uniref:Uncharacterized protein n=1 Tax=Tegillarca granosa TaxID=220873 RepID=A0ABQ9FFN0_TEGGR|nr:hypothetical protein KUTeg_006623 [Tegillarca granosa]KAJ8314479.1 hypothetical protein KUTeg_006629 [Tegillarca granosa]